jgi:hypothetical protein
MTKTGTEVSIYFHRIELISGTKKHIGGSQRVVYRPLLFPAMHFGGRL